MSHRIFRLFGRRWTIAFGLLTTTVMADPILLHYEPDLPVLQRSHVTLDLIQKSPKKTLQTHAYQEAKAEARMTSSTYSPRPQLTVTLNQLRLGFESGDKRVTLDSASPKNSPFLNQIATIIGEPIQVTLGENLHIETTSAAYQRLIKDLKPLNGFSLANLFSEMFQQAFALADKLLEVNTSYTRELKLGADQQVPVTLTYRIIEITPDEVRAVVEGNIKEVSFQLAPGVLSQTEAATVQAKASIKGKAVWSRANALVHRSKIHCLYEGTIIDHDTPRPFQLQLEHQDWATLLGYTKKSSE